MVETIRMGGDPEVYSSFFGLLYHERIVAKCAEVIALLDTVVTVFF